MLDVYSIHGVYRVACVVEEGHCDHNTSWCVYIYMVCQDSGTNCRSFFGAVLSGCYCVFRKTYSHVFTRLELLPRIVGDMLFGVRVDLVAVRIVLLFFAAIDASSTTYTELF